MQRQQAKTAGHAAKACTEERNLTSCYPWNQSLMHLPPQNPRTWMDMTRTSTPEPFQKRRVHCPGRSAAEAPSHLTINAQVPKLSNQNLPWQHFHIISLFPQSPKTCRKLEIEETDLRLASCLLAIQFPQ